MEKQIAVINQFTVPRSSERDFLDFFTTHIKLIASQPGNMECRLFKKAASTQVVEYISLVSWADQEVMKEAGANIDKASQAAGIDVAAFQAAHSIEVVNNRCVEVDVL